MISCEHQEFYENESSRQIPFSYEPRLWEDDSHGSEDLRNTPVLILPKHTYSHWRYFTSLRSFTWMRKTERSINLCNWSIEIKDYSSTSWRLHKCVSILLLAYYNPGLKRYLYSLSSFALFAKQKVSCKDFIGRWYGRFGSLFPVSSYKSFSSLFNTSVDKR